MARYHYQVTLSGAQGDVVEDFAVDPGSRCHCGLWADQCAGMRSDEGSPRCSRIGVTEVGMVVAAELRFAAARSGSKKLAGRIDLILSALEILPLEAPADRHYGDLRHHLRVGEPPSGPTTCSSQPMPFRKILP